MGPCKIGRVRFQEFRERGNDGPWRDTVVRNLLPCDVGAVSAILAEREGVGLDHARDVVSRWAEPDRQRLVLVAEHDGRLEGYGKAELLAPGTAGGTGPTGWYLTGLVVRPSGRRRGVGTRLTEERIRALAERASEIWYFANLRNRATIALHERMGFVLHSCTFHIPGVSFDGGEGGLFRLRLAEPTQSSATGND